MLSASQNLPLMLGSLDSPARYPRRISVPIRVRFARWISLWKDHPLLAAILYGRFQILRLTTGDYRAFLPAGFSIFLGFLLFSNSKILYQFFKCYLLTLHWLVLFFWSLCIILFFSEKSKNIFSCIKKYFSLFQKKIFWCNPLQITVSDPSRDRHVALPWMLKGEVPD